MKKAIFLGVFLTLLVPSFSFAALNTNLKYGAKGSAVVELQEFLTDQGVCDLEPTGNFFALTLRCVKAFQTREGISPASGYWGPMTQAKASTMLDLTSSDADEQKETGTVSEAVVPCLNGAVFNTLTGSLCQAYIQTPPIQTQVVTPAAAQTITAPSQPSVIYSINVTSTVDDHSYSDFHARLNSDNQYVVNIMKGPVSIDDYRAENPTNPNHTPTAVGGTIKVINNSEGTTKTLYIIDGTLTPSDNFTIHPTSTGNISISLFDETHGVTKNISIQVLDTDTYILLANVTDTNPLPNTNQVKLASFQFGKHNGSSKIANLQLDFKGTFDLEQLHNIYAITTAIDPNIHTSKSDIASRPYGVSIPTELRLNPSYTGSIDIYGDVGNSTGTLTTNIMANDIDNTGRSTNIKFTGQTITVQ